MDLWMKLFGIKCLVTEIPSVFHLLILCLGIFLLLRESDWPDWQKAIVLASAFVLWVAGLSYRFDDYHVTTESFILYSLVMLLLLAKPDSARRQFALAAAMGILCGFTITSRINDGRASLLAATSVCLLVLARKRKLFVAILFVVTSALTAVLVVEVYRRLALRLPFQNSLFPGCWQQGRIGQLTRCSVPPVWQRSGNATWRNVDTFLCPDLQLWWWVFSRNISGRGASDPLLWCSSWRLGLF